MEKIHIEIDFYNKYRKLNNNFDMKKNVSFLPNLNLKNLPNLDYKMQKPQMNNEEKYIYKDPQKEITQNKRGINYITKDYSSQKVRQKAYSSIDFDPIYDTSDNLASQKKSIGHNHYYKEMVTPQLKNPIYYIPLCANMAIRKKLNKLRNRIELEIVSKPIDINLKPSTKIEEKNLKSIDIPSLNKYTKMMDEEEKRSLSVERFKEQVIKNKGIQNIINLSSKNEEIGITQPENVNLKISQRNKLKKGHRNVTNSARDYKPPEIPKLLNKIHRSQIDLNQGNKL